MENGIGGGENAKCRADKLVNVARVVLRAVLSISMLPDTRSLF
jgi:hypothetical protein